MSMQGIRRLYGQQEVIQTYAAAQTLAVLVPAIGNKQIHVDYVKISADGTSTFQLKDTDGGVIDSVSYLGAGSGSIQDTPMLRTPKGKGLAITTVGAVNSSIRVVYHTIGGEGQG